MSQLGKLLYKSNLHFGGISLSMHDMDDRSIADAGKISGQTPFPIDDRQGEAPF